GSPRPWACKLIERIERMKVSQTKDRADPRTEVRTMLEASREGVTKSTLANVMTILSLDPEWIGVGAYDAFRGRPVLMKPPPQRVQDRVARPIGSDWSEQDSTRTATWIAEAYGANPPSKTVTEAVMAIAQRRIVDPPAEYLDGLSWDVTARIDHFF